MIQYELFQSLKIPNIQTDRRMVLKTFQMFFPPKSQADQVGKTNAFSKVSHKVDRGGSKVLGKGKKKKALSRLPKSLY